MPGEETKWQPAGLQTQGLYQPQQTQLHYTPVPMANYAPMMAAIENAGSNILKYLNPATIEQMKTEVASSKAGQQFLQMVQKDPWYMKVMGGMQGGQLNISPAASGGQAVVGMLGTPGSTKGDGTDGEGKTVYNKGTGSEGAQKGTQQTGTQQTGGQQTGGQQTGNQQNPLLNPAPNATIDTEPLKIVNPGGNVARPGDSSSTNNYFGNPNAFAANNPAAAPGGGGNGAPPAYLSSYSTITDTPGQGQGTTVAATDNQGNVNQNLSASTSDDFLLRRRVQQQQADQENQQNLINWQNSNQGGVMSAVSAKEWAQHNLDTDINRAVYLPHGGPAGPNGQQEPAYAFYGKKGGTNIVPVSQMVKAGAGPLVVAQNSSQVLNVADQQNKAVNGANQPGGLPGHIPYAPGTPNGPPAAPGAAAPAPDQNQSGSPTPGAAQLGGTPQVPGENLQGGTNFAAIPGQLPADEFNRRVAAATNVQATGGPPANQLRVENLANANGSSDANGIRTDNKPEINDGDPGYVQRVTGMSPDGFNQALSDYQKNGPAGPPSETTGDPLVKRFGNFDWYQDMSSGRPGLLYTRHPGPQLFTESRLYQGGNSWEPTPLPGDVLKRNLMELMPNLSVDKLNAMSREELESKIAEQYYIQKILPNGGRAPQSVLDELSDLNDRINNGTRILNATDGQNPKSYNKAAMDRNQLTRNAAGETVDQPVGLNDVWNNVLAFKDRVLSGQPQENSRLTYIQNQYRNLQAKVAGHTVVPGSTEEQAIDGRLGGLYAGSPSFRSDLQNQINDWKMQFQKKVDGAEALKQKIPGQYIDMNNDMRTGKPWYDESDYYGPGSKRQPGAARTAQNENHPSSNATPPPAPTPTPSGPKPGSSKLVPIDITSDDQYNNTHGAYVRGLGKNGQPEVRWKP